MYKLLDKVIADETFDPNEQKNKSTPIHMVIQWPRIIIPKTEEIHEIISFINLSRFD